MITRGREKDRYMKIHERIGYFLLLPLLGMVLSISGRAQPVEGKSLAESCLEMAEQAEFFQAEVWESEYTDEERAQMRTSARALYRRSHAACKHASEQARGREMAAAMAARAFLSEGKLLEIDQRFEEALEVYEIGSRQVSGLDGGSSSALVPLLERQGEMLNLTESYSESRRVVERALQIRREIYGSKDPRVVPGLMLLAVSYHPFRGESPEEMEALGRDPEKAEAIYREALTIALESDQEEQSEEVANALAILLRFMGRTEEAEILSGVKISNDSMGSGESSNGGSAAG